MVFRQNEVDTSSIVCELFVAEVSWLADGMKKKVKNEMSVSNIKNILEWIKMSDFIIYLVQISVCNAALQCNFCFLWVFVIFFSVFVRILCFYLRIRFTLLKTSIISAWASRRPFFTGVSFFVASCMQFFKSNDQGHSIWKTFFVIFMLF